MELDAFFIAYISFWSVACLLAIQLAYSYRDKMVLFTVDYYYYITVPWKFVTFIIAITGMIIIAPYTGDPTWDYFDAFFMSVLAWYTAPWVIGVIFKNLTQKTNPVQLYVAICCWLFSVSWSYDLYILLRDGFYPITWWSNLVLSSILYLCAGLMWNLEYWPKVGMKFGFMRNDWPDKIEQKQLIRIFWFALPFIILVSALIISFVVPVPFLSWK